MAPDQHRQGRPRRGQGVKIALILGGVFALLVVLRFALAPEPPKPADPAAPQGALVETGTTPPHPVGADNSPLPPLPGINDFDENGMTLLDKAAEADDPQVIEWLVRRGADVDLTSRGWHKGPALHLALYRHRLRAARKLIELGADANKWSLPDGYGNSRTGFHLAAERGDARMLEILIARGADVNAPTRGNRIDTPLHLAAFSGGGKVEVLLEHGARVDARSSYGSTPLHNAAAKGVPRAVDALLEHGADVNARNAAGYTPLRMAMIRWEEPVIKRLIEKGADVNITDEAGGTPLMSTITVSHYETGRRGGKPAPPERARLLLDAGADPNVRDKYDTTALTTALGRKNFPVARLLLERGADPDIGTYRGKTAAMLACETGDEDLIARVLDKGR